jgi:TonB-dependent starch-binding outer membrane protein SusC
MKLKIHFNGLPLPDLPCSRQKRQTLIKYLIAMKLFFTIIIFSLNVSAGVYSQKVNITVSGASLHEVMKQIRKQTGHYFMYTSSILKDAKPVSVDLKNAELNDALQVIFEDQPFVYTMQDDAILIKRKPTENLFFKKVVDVIEAITIRGKVVDEEGKPLFGVTVRKKNSNTGSITNENGDYEIDAEENGTLVFSHVGYITQELAVNGRSSITLTLKEYSEKLTEVVIPSTGYETIPKERATGSFGFVGKELFNREVSPDIISRLNGIAPSLLFNQKAGDTKLSIRGRSTILANDKPLIVVDNFPIEGDINSINPNDVESITILRDAAAASIWGVRAGNGVIVITTKKGITGKPILDFNTNLTIAGKPDLYYKPRISTTDFIDVEKQLFNLGRYDADISNTITNPPISLVVDILLKKRNNQISDAEANAQINSLRSNDLREDLLSCFYRRSVNQQYALSTRGGTETFSYYFSGGYDQVLHNKAGNQNNRITFNNTNNFRPLKGLDISLNVFYSQSNYVVNNTLSDITTSGSIDAYPYSRLVGENGLPLPLIKNFSSTFINSAESVGFLSWAFIPLEEIKYTDSKIKTLNARANAAVKYEIISGLSIEARYQYEREDAKNSLTQTSNSYFTRNLINTYSTISGGVVTRNIPVGDILSRSNQYMTTSNGRGQVNYFRVFTKHEVSFLGGYEVREVRNNGYSSRLYGYDANTGSYANVDYLNSYPLYPSGFGTTIPNPSDVTGIVDRFRSYFGNIGYNYDSRYGLSASIRRDESNLFGVAANKKGVPLWSVGTLWNIHNEPFYNERWPEIKLRASYGVNGNFDNTVTALTTARFLGNSFFVSQPNAVLSSPPNEHLGWERIKVVNFGVDFSTRSHQVTGSVDIYQKKGTNMIGVGPINPTTGFSTFKGNIANMSSRGVDIVFNAIPVDKIIKWHSTVLLSYQTDNITKYDLKPDPGNMMLDISSMAVSNSSLFTPVVGRPLFAIYSYKSAGLSSTGDPQGYLNGKASSDYANLLQTVPDSLYYNGRATPPIFGAFRNTVSYKNFSLSFNIQYRFGYYFRRASIDYTNLVNAAQGHGDFADRWLKPGDENVTTVPAFTYPNNPSRDLFYSRSSDLVEKGDNIRLQDIRLSASVPSKLAIQWGIRMVEFYIYGSNIGLMWKTNKNKLDPDYGAFIPPSKSIAFGIKAIL